MEKGKMNSIWSRILMAFVFSLIFTIGTKFMRERSAEAKVELKSDLKPESSQKLLVSELLDDPDKFDGSEISVEGYATFQFEGTVLYESMSDLLKHRCEKAIWLQLASHNLGEFVQADSKRVLLSGKFNSKGTGHFGCGKGRLENVRLVTW